jgi:hypothetical protein
MTAVRKAATSMPMPASDTTWDFTPVFNLIQTLSKHDSPALTNELSKLESRRLSQVNGRTQGQIKSGLGNLNQVWDYLGVQRDVPPPAIAPFERSTATAHENQDTYASDGALYYPPSAKSVKWRDEEAGQNLTDVQDSPPSNDESTRLTKTQRKKLNRKARKAAEQSNQLTNEHRSQQSVLDSGEDSEDMIPTPSKTKIGLHQGVVRPENLAPKKITSWAEKKLETGQETPALPHSVNYSIQDAAPKANEAKPVIKQASAKPAVARQEAVTRPAIKQDPSPKTTVKQETPSSAPRPISFSVEDAVRAVQEAQNRLPPFSQSPTYPRQSSSKIAVAPTANISVKDFSKSPSRNTPKPATNVTAKQHSVNASQPRLPASPNTSIPAVTSIAARRGTAINSNEPTTPLRPGLPTIHQSLQKVPVTQPAASQSLLTQALSMKTPVQKGAVTTTPASQPVKSNTTMISTPAASTQTPTRRRNNEIVPLKDQTSVDRNWDLLLKLMNNFPLDRKHLLSPLQLSINRPAPNGIHVFVDASNIMIGFMDALKRARGIPPWQRVNNVDLNFHALALLMERRRPVARRILAGSTPELTAFEEARQVGYETNILDKVYKAKELTERQRYFALQDQERKHGNNGYNSGSDSARNGLSAAKAIGGGTPKATAALTPAEAMAVAFGTSPVATATLPPQNPKWIEQAVDEILHLKILESVVDTDIPHSAWADPTLPNTAPTMVVATGDAAEAEYSQGFMKMVQRALSKGWNVEVAAWGKSVSQEYRRMESSKVLGERFKIIELDGYAEELFGESIDGQGVNAQ